MKILIVDDEDLTRNGLIQSIDWKSLGISQVLQADDGLNGLKTAQKNMPDIILTDVRMPRMNGIEMSEHIQQQNPDCPIIFMSGYSDKEYLKAAIKLRAVRYVEKPINPQEIEEAVHEAVLFAAEKKLHFKTQALFQKEAASRLALHLTKSGFSLEESEDYSPESLKLPIHNSSFFTTLIIKFSKKLSEFVETDLSALLQQLNELARKRKFHQIHTLKNEEFLILHLFGSERPTAYILERFCKDVSVYLEKYKEFFIVAGKTVIGPEKVYQSYHSAVILLQNAFFYPYGSILLADTDSSDKSAPQIQSLPEQFSQALISKNTKQAAAFADQLYQVLMYNHTLLAIQAKDIYYKMLTDMNSAAYQLKLSTSTPYPASAFSYLKDFFQPAIESPMELVAKCNTLEELQRLLTSHLEAFEQLLDNAPEENSTVFLIRDYIGKHYMNDQLSIKDISDHVHLSSSYICTIFKTETGQTLNQYITEYRMEKAKQLLANPRNKINEISAKVGYADGNYFGKSFKKVVGLSPSEYREKELS